MLDASAFNPVLNNNYMYLLQDRSAQSELRGAFSAIEAYKSSLEHLQMVSTEPLLESL